MHDIRPLTHDKYAFTRQNKSLTHARPHIDEGRSKIIMLLKLYQKKRRRSKISSMIYLNEQTHMDFTATMMIKQQVQQLQQINAIQA
jgi:hypothetical protein